MVKKNTLLISFILLLLLVSGLFTLFVMSVDRSAVSQHEESFNEQQGLHVSLAANSVRAAARSVLNTSELLAASLQDPGEDRGFEVLLATVSDINEYILCVSVLDASGTPVAQNYRPTEAVPEPWAFALRMFHAHREGVIAGDGPYVPPFIVTPREQLMTVMYAVEYGGAPAVLAVVADLGLVLRRFVKPMRSGKYGAGYALDGQGRILYDHEEEIIGRSVFDGMHDKYPNLVALDRRIVSEESGKAAYTFTVQRGKQTSRKLLAWSTVLVGERRIAVALSAPDIEINDTLTSLRRMYMVLALLFIAIFAALGLAFYRKRRVETLRVNEQRFRWLADAAWEGILILKGGALHLANPQFYELFKYSPEELAQFLGAGGAEETLIHEPPELLREKMAVAGESGVVETVGRKRDGEIFPVEIRSRMLEMEKGPALRVLAFRDVTAQKNAEKALKEQLTFTQALINAIPNPIFFKDLNFTYLGCNEAFATFAQRPMREIIGKDDFALFEKNTAEIFRTMDSRMLITWKMKSGQFQVVSQGGDAMQYDILVSPLRSAEGSFIGIVGSMRNVTELHSAAKELQASEIRHRAIFEHSALGIALLDLHGDIVSANTAFCGMVRAQCEGVLGRNFFIFTDFQESSDAGKKFIGIGASLARAVLNDMDQDQSSRFQSEIMLTPTEGARIWANLTLTMVRTRFGRPQYAIAMVEEIDARKKAEAELARLNKDLERRVLESTRDLRDKADKLEQANIELKHLDDLKSGFVSSVSHELRTPLTSLLGFSKLIRKTFHQHFEPLAGKSEFLQKKSAAIDDNLGIMVLEGERLTRLINNVLDLNKIESGKMTWLDELVDLKTVIYNAVTSVGGAFGERPDVFLEVDIAEDLPATLVDEDKIAQVMSNLLSNAAKYTRKGLIRVTAQHPAPGYVRVVVSDTGMGMDKEDLALVFDEFYQATQEDTLVSSTPGTGLGLPICKHIIEHYGGVIWAESAPGRGACVIFELPVRSSPNSPETSAEE